MSENDVEVPVQSWMKPLLRAAAIYNLVWGSWVILFPLSSLRICGFGEPVTYPELWQCIGMIVGVYGVGYWIAASDPYRHWPVILVGFLGKVLGPIGFLYSWGSGRLPLSAGIVNIFNDLIWWVPFAIILWRSVRFEMTRTTTAGGAVSLASALQQFLSQRGESLAELSQGQRLLVVFLRHSGCTFCREALAEIQRQRPEIEKAKVHIALVHMEDDARGQAFFEKYHLEDLPRFSDPEQVLYRAFEIGLGKFRQLMGLRVLWRGFQSAIVHRHGFDRIRNNVFRMPGTVLLENGDVIRRFVPQTAADHPDYQEFACSIE